jgi:fermentation-respiration switch protein FrsA (DUF1100 family)
MANSANVRSELQVFVGIDSDATLATGTPASVLCNREYDIADYYFNIITNAQVGNDQLLIESAATVAGAGVSQGAVAATAVASLRPTTITAGAANNWLAAGATVARGSFLRVTASAGDAAVRAIGFISIMPGNRYAAGNGTYYPNNGAALRYQA